jgi:salicylate hydroxylase
VIQIIGAGIGGLAAALALRRVGASVRVIERAAEAAEIGAGIQLGPNATRLLDQWGCLDALRAHASAPAQVQASAASTGKVLGTLPLQHFAQTYGAPYLTVHRAQLQRVLLDRAAARSVQVRWGEAWGDTPLAEDDVLIGCDGVRSAVRAKFWPQASAALHTSHWAWRALLPLDAVPPELRTQVTAWLGPQMHAVGYAVGAHYNWVAFTEDPMAVDSQQLWSEATSRDVLLTEVTDSLSRRRERVGVRAGAGTDRQLEVILKNLPQQLTRWPVLAMPPLKSAADMAKGKVALLGDAAHAMRPYLAQGAAMAIEDAAVLARCIASMGETEKALQTYAYARWWRNARVQRKAHRNGQIFHATGPLAWARDLAMRVQPGVMDTPWLYGYRVDADRKPEAA